MSTLKQFMKHSVENYFKTSMYKYHCETSLKQRETWFTENCTDAHWYGKVVSQCNPQNIP